MGMLQTRRRSASSSSPVTLPSYCSEDYSQYPQHSSLSSTQDHVNAYSSLIRLCADSKSLSEGINIHAHIVEHALDHNRFLGNLLLHMYGNCGSLRDARAVFDNLRDRNVFSWSLIIRSYTQHNDNREALKLFQAMLSDGLMPDRVIFVNMISVCASLEILAIGKWMHSFISTCGYASDVVLGTALIHMYGKCGSIATARTTFKHMQTHDTIAWTALISSYAQHGYLNEAIFLYDEMKRDGIVPNRVTFACILDACANKAAIVQGKRIHEDVKDCGLEGDVVVGNALISLYGKCGRLKQAHQVFKKMRYRDVVSWTALISAYAQQGRYKDALKLFNTMLSRNVTPDKVAFLIVLSTCSHAGLVKQAFDYFYSMKPMYQVSPALEHYNCMVDLFGRLGQLKEGENMIKEMPMEPNATTWMTMLGACSMHADVERGEQAAKRVFKLDPENPTPYVLLSNVYALAGRWEDAKKARQRMKDLGLKKQQGHSLIEVDGRVHEFVAGDVAHPKTPEIHAELLSLSSQMKDMGYVPDTKAVLHNVEEDEKESMLHCHSEKLAVAYGIISTPPETSLCIIKNLRICHDCHSAMKYISKLKNRKIIVRDAVRFHVFKHGVCSCADYW